MLLSAVGVSFAGLVSLFLFPFLPTLGPLAYLWHGPISYIPTSGLYQAELIPLLRQHRLDSIDLGALRGLVGPPSFHAASAMLYTLAAWRLPRFRVGLTALNLAMLFSIPVEGTHSTVDVISGVAVAILAYHAICAYTMWPAAGLRPSRRHPVPAITLSDRRSRPIR